MAAVRACTDTKTSVAIVGQDARSLRVGDREAEDGPAPRLGPHPCVPAVGFGETSNRREAQPNARPLPSSSSVLQVMATTSESS